MIKPDRLHKTQFAHNLTKDSTDIAKILLTLRKAKKPKQSEREMYIHQVLDSFSELQRIVENLDMAEIFLKSYSVSKRWNDRYDQNHYFTYHYEMWILNAVRLYERLLILINSVYWLEISHKDITYLTVAKHPKLKKTETLKILNLVHGAISNLQGVKNSVFHRYIYTDDALEEISRFNFLARNSAGEEKEKYSFVAKFKMKYIYLPNKRREVENNNQQLLKAVDGIFNTLNQQYIKHRDSLSKT